MNVQFSLTVAVQTDASNTFLGAVAFGRHHGPFSKQTEVTTVILDDLERMGEKP